MTNEVLYEGKYIRLVRHDNWEFVERVGTNGVVVILAVTDDRKLVLCQQYRVPVETDVIELPAGLANDSAVNAEESLEEAARREFLEETGYEAHEMTPLFEGPAASGSSSAMVSFYRASGLKKVGQGGGDDTENIRVHEVPLAQLDAWLSEARKQNKMIDPKVFTALYFLREYEKD